MGQKANFSRACERMAVIAIACAWTTQVLAGRPLEGLLTERTRYYSVRPANGAPKHYAVRWVSRYLLNPGSQVVARNDRSGACGTVSVQRIVTPIDPSTMRPVGPAITSDPDIVKFTPEEFGEGACPDELELYNGVARTLQARMQLHDSEAEWTLRSMVPGAVSAQSWTFPDQVNVRFKPGDPDRTLADVFDALHSINALPVKRVAIDVSASMEQVLLQSDVIFNKSTDQIANLLTKLNTENTTVKIRRIRDEAEEVSFQDDKPAWLSLPDLKWRSIESVQLVTVPRTTNLGNVLHSAGLYSPSQFSPKRAKPYGPNSKARRIYDLNRELYGQLNVQPGDAFGILEASGVTMRVPVESLVIPLPRRLITRLPSINPDLARRISDIEDPSLNTLQSSSLPDDAHSRKPTSPVLNGRLEDCLDPDPGSFGRLLESIGMPAQRRPKPVGLVYVLDSFDVPASAIEEHDTRRLFIERLYKKLDQLKSDKEFYKSIRTKRRANFFENQYAKYLSTTCKDHKLPAAECARLGNAVQDGYRDLELNVLQQRLLPTYAYIERQLELNPEFRNDVGALKAPSGTPNKLARDGNHGYHVVGIIGAQCNGYGFGGAAAGAKIVPFGIAVSNDPPYMEKFVAGSITAGIDQVINAGGNCSDRMPCIVNVSMTQNAPQAARGLARTLRELTQRMLIVSAAGNRQDSQSCGTEKPTIPACLGYPFRTNVLTVTSGELVSPGDSRRLIANSGVGSHVSLIAPGREVVSIGRQGYFVGSGTSQATAFVTSVAVALRARGRYSAAEIAERLLYTADLHTSVPGDQVQFGWINADRAVEKDPNLDWLAKNGGDAQPGQLTVVDPQSRLQLYTRKTVNAPTKVINPAAIRRISRDTSSTDKFSYVVVYRDRILKYASRLDQQVDSSAPDENGRNKRAESFECGLKILRGVYFLKLQRDNSIAASGDLCDNKGLHCPKNMFEFQPNNGPKRFVSLLEVDDLVVSMDRNVNEPESGTCH